MYNAELKSTAQDFEYTALAFQSPVLDFSNDFCLIKQPPPLFTD